MKKSKEVLKGPRVQYFEHRHGIVNARKSLVRRTAPALLSMMIVSGAVYGALNFRNSRVASLRATDVAGVSVQKEQIQEDSSKPKEPVEDKGLGGEIQKKIKSMPKSSKWSVSVRDLKSERMANVNADQKHDSADLYKLYLLAPLESKLNADSWKTRMAKMTTKDCVETMIKQTEKDCGQAIGNYVNWKTLDITNASYGFSKTSVESITQSQTTARETLDLMYRLQSGKILTDKARRVVFDGFYEQQMREGIPNGCGNDCLVGSMPAGNDKVKHQVAVVTHGQAKYVVVILTTGGTWDQIADLTKTIDENIMP